MTDQGHRIQYGQVRPGRTNNCLVVLIIICRAGKNVKTKGTQHLLSRENPLPAIRLREDPFPAFAFPRGYPLKTQLGPFTCTDNYVDCGMHVTLTHPIIA